MGAIRDYLDQLGLLDFKGKPIDQILTSKDKQAQPQFDTSQLDQRLSMLDQREQAIAMAERRTTVMASKTDFVAEHGKAVSVPMHDVMKKQREARRKIIRQWTRLPKDRRQSTEEISEFARTAAQQNENAFVHSRRDPYEKIMGWLLPRAHQL